MIRIATKGDIFNVSLLWLKMINEMKPENKPNVKLWRTYCRKLMNAGDYIIFLYENEKGILGFLDFFLFREPSDNKIHAVGQHFYVMPELRGSRIAWMLYNAALKKAKEFKAQVFGLFCFENEKSFWKRKGYIPFRNFMIMEVV